MPESTKIDDAHEAVAFLTAQHKQIKAIFERVGATSGGKRAKLDVASRS